MNLENRRSREKKIKKTVKKALLFLAFFFVSAGTIFAANEKTSAPESPIIPAPATFSAKSGQFVFKPSTQIVARTPEALKVANFFAKEIERATGMALKVGNAGTTNAVVLKISKAAKGDDEAYTLDVSPTGIVVSAKTAAGLFYGIQTIRQLMPPEIYSRVPVKEKISWSVPAVKISDSPRFKWRGAHLDCGRHFYSKQELMRILDAMSWHKLNKFHWHLTEDQGWRLEIKRFPKLTKIGAWRKNLLIGENPNFVKEDSDKWNSAGLYGGFYSQKDVKEIVEYARERFIEIVPEIEIPGHSVAALVAYPEFSCNGKSPGEIPLKGGVYPKVFCPGKESTFKFWESVFAEVCEMFPGKYVHLGADECPKGNWKNCADCQKRIKTEKLKAAGTRSAEDKLQSYAIARVQKFLEKKGKKVIAWDEITEGGIPENVTVMHWREQTDPKIAPNEGKDLIIATRPTCYYNWAYDAADKSFILSQGAVMSLRQAYNFEPIPKGLSPKLQKHVLGAQSAFWGEKAPNIQIVEFHLFPRLSAMSEATWSVPEKKNWNDFSRRIEIQQKRYKAAGLNARPSVISSGYKAWEKYDLKSSGTAKKSAGTKEKSK